MGHDCRSTASHANGGCQVASDTRIQPGGAQNDVAGCKRRLLVFERFPSKAARLLRETLLEMDVAPPSSQARCKWPSLA